VGVGRSIDGVRGVHRFSAQVGGRVLHQGDVVAELHRKAPCRLDADVGDHADDDHPLNAELLELLVQGLRMRFHSPILVEWRRPILY
jgi:hypothetical protein